jgi:5-methylcytosine-specific restriction endonuclease McrA
MRGYFGTEKSLYPSYWKQLSAYLRTLKPYCEVCGARDREPHPVTGKLVIIAVAHLDHNPRNCAINNLKTMCARCHLKYDREQHIKNARITRWKRRQKIA